jgi:MoCo/4Fe-4S cofactor protein with predicted Tat translocation signal
MSEQKTVAGGQWPVAGKRVAEGQAPGGSAGLVQIQGQVQGQTQGKSEPAGLKYWRSLNELAHTEKFQKWVENEFPTSHTELLDGNSRRAVLKVMAASFGLAGLAACHRPEVILAPTSRGREDYVPGAPYQYTSVMTLNGHSMGLLVETYDGRPTKIEGNNLHPGSLGAATALAQGSLLNLYDPDRSKEVLENGKASTWDKFAAAAKGLLTGDGSGVVFLSETVMSPTLADLRAQAQKKFPKAQWVEYESISRTNELSGAFMAFGQEVDAHPQYDKAKVILSLDYDFLGNDYPAPLAAKLFSQGRRVESEEDLDKLNRMYMVESQFSLTGANADHRLRMRGGDVKQFAADLLAALSAVPSGSDKRAKFLAAAAKDLKAAGPTALVIAGPRQPAIVHALAHAMNQTLGSAGTTITFSKSPQTLTKTDPLALLTTAMNMGQVSTLVIFGGNPVYAAPADLQFAAAMAKVANTIYLGPDPDETAAAAKWNLPEAHYLETWGDARTATGVPAIQQPMIEPLFGGKSAIEVMALLLDTKDKKGYDLVKNYWLGQMPANSSKEMTWRRALNDGVLKDAKAAEAVKPTADLKKIAAAVAAERPAAGGGLEVGFVASASAWDGRFANNAWMQEAPEPMTKLVWGNAALMSPATAREKNIRDTEIVTLSKGNLKLEAAVLVQPGHADNCVTIALGYGRARAGRVGKDVGFNAGLLRTTDGFWFGSDFAIAGSGKFYELVTTQERGGAPGLLSTPTGDAYRMNDRPLYREATVGEYKAKPKVIEEMNEVPEIHSIYSEWTWDKGHQWGMAIDLGTCTGCNACVVACQAENNIPSVGKDQVRRGREMHWIRMDRYYVGPEDDPRAVEQPLPCMQCENAPCENVCPVAATSHSPEGLNDMAYNRCVGTRYCANNCPFKVRHFNFLNWHKNEPEIMAMVQNPDVTVRMRGIMEKCTYCVQRIQEARITAKTNGRKDIQEGDVITACQQTCPAGAIVFGDINDPNSRVSKLKKQERNYAMLAELGIKPRTTYLARLRNPNPELEA